jgi:hypothetical protein
MRMRQTGAHTDQAHSRGNVDGYTCAANGHGTDHHGYGAESRRGEFLRQRARYLIVIVVVVVVVVVTVVVSVIVSVIVFVIVIVFDFVSVIVIGDGCPPAWWWRVRHG